MSLNFADVPNSSGGFFKPEPHKNAVALLIEVKGFERQRPGQFGPKDTVDADVTIFASEADLDAGKAEVLTGTQIQATVLARDLASLVGSATIQKLDTVASTTPGRNAAWVWRPVEASIKDKVVAYATKREADRQAALAAAPDFD